jgi:hypothetical protein
MASHRPVPAGLGTTSLPSIIFGEVLMQQPMLGVINEANIETETMKEKQNDTYFFFLFPRTMHTIPYATVA